MADSKSTQKPWKPRTLKTCPRNKSHFWMAENLLECPYCTMTQDQRIAGLQASILAEKVSR